MVRPQPTSNRTDTLFPYTTRFRSLRNLWACWALLAKARAARAPLDLDLPERQVILDEQGGIAEIRVRDRLDSMRLIEDYMIAANVAAAKALEAKQSRVLYCIQDPPRHKQLGSRTDQLHNFEQNCGRGRVEHHTGVTRRHGGC